MTRKTRVCCFVGIVCLLVVGNPTLAAEISAAQARTAVENWVVRDFRPMGARIGQTVRSTQTFSDHAGNALFHVVRFQEGGFVVTSADDGIQPVIAFSEGDDLVADERNTLWVMLNRDLPQRRTAAQKRAALRLLQVLPETDEHHAAWQNLLSSAGGYETLGVSSVSDVRVSPLLTTTWDQTTAYGGACYNYYTPPNTEGSTANYYCGCVATAGAQLMRYHLYPTSSVAAKKYTIRVSGSKLQYSLKGGVYDWSNMATNPSASSTILTQRQSIGKLTYDVGVASHMSYTSSGSSAYDGNLVDALKSPFGYASAFVVMDNSGVESCLSTAVLPNLDAHYPVLFGIENSSIGHEVVGDGYGYLNGTLYIHLNLGWSGSQNAWYNLPTVDTTSYTFTLLSSIVFNVFPLSTGEIISGRVLDGSGNSVAGAAVVATNLTTNVGLSAVITDAKGIYAFQVPSSSSFKIVASIGTRAASITASASASVSTTYFYDSNSDSMSYYSGTAAIGNSWGNNLTLPDPPPDAPTAVSASDGASTASVSVAWTAVTSATGYGVYRFTSSSSNSASLLGQVAVTNYTDSTAVPGALYYYWVKATNAMGASAFSAPDTGYRALSAPAGVSATESSTGGVTVTWGAVTGASYYRVYRAVSAGGTKTALGSWQTAMTYVDTSAAAGVTYYYWAAAAVDDSGTRASAYGDYDTGLRLAAVALAVALDATNLVWTTGGDTGWFGQTNATHDGADAARSGALADGQTNWLQTAVTGPGTLSFWWCASSEAGSDALAFAADGTNLWSISGATNWTQQTASLGVGTHTLAWTYAKNGSGSTGADCGWVDQVVWTQTGTSTTEVSVPYAWLDAYGLVTDGDYESAAKADADGDGYTAWQEYVVGTSPTNAASVFLADIAISNDVPVIVWTPDLGTARVYTVEGKSSLTNAVWLSPTNSDSRFFRVTVFFP